MIVYQKLLEVIISMQMMGIKVLNNIIRRCLKYREMYNKFVFKLSENYMISKFFKKIPAAIIIVPMFIASILYTLAPGLLKLGPMSEAIASKEGLNAIIDITLVAVGSQLTIKRFKLALHRGLVLLISK